MKEIKFNDLKTIGYSFKVPTNDVEDKYTTYTVIDYNEDVKDFAGLPCVQIILSINNTDKKGRLFYKDSFIKYSIDTEIGLKQTLLDGDTIRILFY